MEALRRFGQDFDEAIGYTKGSKRRGIDSLTVVSKSTLDHSNSLSDQTICHVGQIMRLLKVVEGGTLISGCIVSSLVLQLAARVFTPDCKDDS